MARHVYSILCRRAIIDRDGGQVSHHEVIERVTFERIPSEDSRKLEELEESGGGFAVPGGMHLVSWWVRSDYEVPEATAYRISFLTPDGQASLLAGLPVEEAATGSPKPEFLVNLSSYTGSRRIIRLGGIPRWGGFGLYWFVIELQEEEGEWVEVTRIPLEIHEQSDLEQEKGVAPKDHP